MRVVDRPTRLGRGLAAIVASILATGCAGTEPVKPQVSHGDAATAGAVAQATPHPLETEAALRRAEEWLREEVTASSDRLEVTFEGPAVDLTPPTILDIEFGNGHGGSLDLVRLTVGAHETSVERVSWQAYHRPKPEAGQALRGTLETLQLGPLLDAIRALSRARVKWTYQGSIMSSTVDFFVLVRVCGTDPSADRIWQFAGYWSEDKAEHFAAIEPVVTRARELFDTVSFTPIPAKEYRQTHVTDAFRRNRDVLVEPFHWWVLERSLQGLGWFGTPDALPSLEWVAANVKEPNEWRAAMMARIRGRPDFYLEGPARNVSVDPDE